jgi:hypothetical protein
MNVYDFVNSINSNENKTKSLMVGTANDKLAEKTYEPFLVNRTLSYFVDTIMYVQDMNISRQLDRKLQYDYLRMSVRPAKRFKKWDKADKISNLDLIKKHFNYNNQKAITALELLSDEQIEKLKNIYSGK